MRVHFDLPGNEPWTFVVEGVQYQFSALRALARKERLPTLVNEYVFLLPTGKYVYLTAVGDDDQYGKDGVVRGWYVAEILPEKDALWLIDALKPFTALYD